MLLDRFVADQPNKDLVRNLGMKYHRFGGVMKSLLALGKTSSDIRKSFSKSRGCTFIFILVILYLRIGVELNFIEFA
jgi:hypothetical protein